MCVLFSLRGFRAQLERLCVHPCSFAGGGAPFGSRALVHVSFCSEAQLSEMCLERFLVCVCVCVVRLECVRMFKVCREVRRGRKRDTFASLNYPLSVFCALAVVVNFSVSFCCHVRFPVDHALPPPPTLLTSVSSLLSHTLLCLCGFAPMGGSSRRRPLIGWPQKACEDWRTRNGGGG